MFNSVVSPSLQNCSSTGAAAKKVPQFQPPPHVNEAFFSTDDFRMYGFKISKCPRNRSHDWTNCPYAHHGERARRRDPVKVPYLAIACPEFRNNEGMCPRGEGCVFAHGIFEYWLHPDKYRTRPCTLGRCCQRKVCFFAHGPEQVRPETRYHFHRNLQVGDGEPNTKSDDCGIMGSLIVPESGLITSPRHISAAPPILELEYANSQEVIGCDFFSNSSAQLTEEGEYSRELGYDFLNSLREMTIGERGGEGGDGSGVSNNLEEDQVNSPDLPGLEWVWELLK